MVQTFNIKHLKLVLTALHASAAVFAFLVFCLAAASIAESNRAVAAVSRSTQRYSSGTVDDDLDSLDLSSAFSIGVLDVAPFLGFTMFVSITGFLLSTFLATCYLKSFIYDKTLGVLAAQSPPWARWPFYELVVAVIWSIFWLAAAGVASDSPFIKLASWYCTGSACGQMNAVVAFSWLSWFVSLAVVVLLAVEYGMAAHKARSAAVAVSPTAAANATDGKEGKQADIEMGKAAGAGEGKETVIVSDSKHEEKEPEEEGAAAGPTSDAAAASEKAA